jgi:hypothetical protein
MKEIEMRYEYHSFNNLRQDNVLRVNLHGSARVLVMDNINLQVFNRNGRFEYIGGDYSHGVVNIQIPRSGSWNLVVLSLGNSSVRYDFGVI